MARLILVLLGGMLALVAAAAPAFAHAHLEASSPADGAVLASAPTRLELEFSGGVTLPAGALTLTRHDGTSVTLDGTAEGAVVTAPLPADLPDGSYLVSYRVASADGHPAEGELAFRIGGSGAPPVHPDPHSTLGITGLLVVLLTGVQYLGLLGFVGLLVFGWLVQRPPRPAPRRSLGWTWGGGLAASLLLIPAGALRIVGAGPWQVVHPSLWVGAVEWPPVVAAGLCVVAGGGALWLTDRAADSRGGRTWPALAGLLVLVGPLLVGHGRTVEPWWLVLPADLAHLLAAACWFGGLWGLTAELAHVQRLPGPNRDAAAPDLARTVSRFSGLALAAAGLLAVSGLVMASLTLGGLDALPGSEYGRTLLLKLGIVVPVLAIAGWNRFALLPGIVREPTRPGGWDALTRTLRNEVALLVAVLAVTGVLTSLPTP